MIDVREYTQLNHVDEIRSILKSISILAGLSSKQLGSLVRLLQKVKYSADEVIFQQSDQPSHIYIIKSGIVRLVCEKNGTSLELIEFGQGDCVGESSIIGIQPHSVTAIAAEDTELIVLSRNTLLSLYKTDIDLFSILLLNIARETSRRLHASDELLLQYALKE